MNELIEKSLISIGFPFASFMAECISGLIAGIMSAVVLMLFDSFKKSIRSTSNEVKRLQLQSRKLCIEIGHVTVDSIRFYKKLDEHICLALSPVTATSLTGSIKVCEDVGVNPSGICRTAQDVDALLGYF